MRKANYITRSGKIDTFNVLAINLETKEVIENPYRVRYTSKTNPYNVVDKFNESVSGFVAVKAELIDSEEVVFRWKEDDIIFFAETLEPRNSAVSDDTETE